jgi:hypothetical protein
MTIDRYTKAVLTVIAVALVGLVVQNAIGTVVAQPPPQRVQICDTAGRCATLRPYTNPETRAVSYGLQVFEFR